MAGNEDFRGLPITKAVYGPKTNNQGTRPPIRHGASLASRLSHEAVTYMRQQAKLKSNA